MSAWWWKRAATAWLVFAGVVVALVNLVAVHRVLLVGEWAPLALGASYAAGCMLTFRALVAERLPGQKWGDADAGTLALAFVTGAVTAATVSFLAFLLARWIDGGPRSGLATVAVSIVLMPVLLGVWFGLLVGPFLAVGGLFRAASRRRALAAGVLFACAFASISQPGGAYFRVPGRSDPGGEQCLWNRQTLRVALVRAGVQPGRRIDQNALDGLVKSGSLAAPLPTANELGEPVFYVNAHGWVTCPRHPRGVW